MIDTPAHPATTEQALKTEKFLGMRITPITRRRIENFKRNRRGFVSFWIFLVFFIVTLFAEVIANDKPLLVSFNGEFYTPAFVAYPETAFGGEFQTEADYRDEFVAELINEKGWMLWPPIRFSFDTVNYALSVPAPAPPSADNWLGTGDQGRDVVARLIYGFRISVLFGFVLTIISAIVGVSVGAFQGFYGGLIDLLGQRFIEIWAGMPVLYLLIILASIITPNFWWLLGSSCCSAGWVSSAWSGPSSCALATWISSAPHVPWASPTSYLSTSTCCPMLWSPPLPSCRSPWLAPSLR